MDPLLSYLTAQHMASQQLSFPLLQTGTVPMTVQASSLIQPTVSSAQLIGMDQYYKPAAVQQQQQSELQLLQLLNNNYGAVPLTMPQLTVAPTPVVEKQQQQQQPTVQSNEALIALFQQLVAAQSMQHPLFVDHAASLAALTVQQQQQQPQPVNLAAFLPAQPVSTTVLLPTTSVHAPITVAAPSCTQLLPTTTTTVRQPMVLQLQQHPQPSTTVLRPATVPSTVPVARAIPVIRIDSPEIQLAQPGTTAFQVVPRTTVASTLPTVTILQRMNPSPLKQEVISPIKSSSVSSSSRSPSSSWLSVDSASSSTAAPGAATVAASTSKSSSVDEEVESMMSGEEEERYRPEDAFAGKQRRADHIAFHRKMKALLKGLRGSDLICKMCSVRVERHDNAFKAHISEHAAAGANQLECRYCGFETPSRVEMNVHMGERHPHGSERAYTDKRDHLKMIEIMNECFAKVSRPPKPMPARQRDPDRVVKPRQSRKRRAAEAAAAEAAAAAAANAAPGATPAPAAPPSPAPGAPDSFEAIIVRFCTDAKTTEVPCACGDEVPLNPGALLTHVKTLHAQYRCNDCGDLLDSEEEARGHTVKMHGGDAATFAERIVDHVVVRGVQKRFMACFIKKEGRLPKSHVVRVLLNQLDEELSARKKPKKEIKEEIKEEPADS